MKFKVIDLFTGTGAFSYVFNKYKNFESVFANDICKNSEKIYKLNNKDNFLLKDLNDISVETIPKHDLLCGGFPCQPFSLAGNKKGFDDKRSNVFWKIIEILKHHNPRFFILENVKGLLSHDNGNTFSTIKSNLENLGYNLHYKILDTSKLSIIPHHRERIYIVGFKYKADFEKFSLNFPEITNNPISNFLEGDVNQKYYYTEDSAIYEKLKETVVKKGTFYQYRRYYVRENKNGVCPTLTANMGTGGHNVPIILDNKGIRKLTPRECFNLQGFNKDYNLGKISDCNLYKLAGNAISIPVIELIIDKINKLI